MKRTLILFIGKNKVVNGERIPASPKLPSKIVKISSNDSIQRGFPPDRLEPVDKTKHWN